MYLYIPKPRGPKYAYAYVYHLTCTVAGIHAYMFITLRAIRSMISSAAMSRSSSYRAATSCSPIGTPTLVSAESVC